MFLQKNNNKKKKIEDQKWSHLLRQQKFLDLEKNRVTRGFSHYVWHQRARIFQ